MSKSHIRNYKDLINIVNYYFQRLKSGINYSKEYQHSFLKLYLSDKNFNWEKRWLKEQFIGGLEPASEDEKFARAFLGLVGSYSFKPNTRNPREGQVYPRSQVDVTVESADDSVARFKSPITFKPIEYAAHWSIYVFAESVPEDMLNVNFKFSGSNGKTRYLNTPGQLIDIKDLIRAYHQHLGKQFTALTYTGNPSYPVKIATQ